MVAQLRQFNANPRLRNALDWAVFGLGALSLTAAIAGTVLGPAPELRSDSARATTQTTG